MIEEIWKEKKLMEALLVSPGRLYGNLVIYSLPRLKTFYASFRLKKIKEALASLLPSKRHPRTEIKLFLVLTGI